jgi:hypothetical protein
MPSPAPVSTAKMPPPYEPVATTAGGGGVSHSRGGPVGSTAALDQRPLQVVMMNLHDTTARRPDNPCHQMVVDPDELW